MKSLILVHDMGTTAAKTCLFDEDGLLEASRLTPLAVSYPARDRAEQRPADWWRTLRDGTRALLADSGAPAEAVACVSLCGHNPSAVLVDDGDAPLFDSVPIYADLRAAATAEAAMERLGGHDAFYRVTGAGQIPAQYSCFKTAWILRDQPRRARAAAKLLNTIDYLCLRLTGRMATDYSQASNTGFLDISSRKWSRPVLEALEIPPGLLPEIIASTDAAGGVTPEAAAETGLKAGTPVFIGGGDVLCSAAAAIQRPGEYYINLGSAAWIGTLSLAPVLNPATRLVNYCHIDPDYYAPHHAMTGAGITLQWLRDRLYPGEASGGYERMTAEAATAPAGAEGLLFLPYMRGVYAGRHDHRARGVFFGLGLNHGNGHLCRAAMEGVAMAMRDLCEMLARDGLTPGGLRLIGGGSRSELWRRIFADVCGVPVASTAFRQEASSFGAAVAAGVGMGMFDSFRAAGDLNPADTILEPDPEAARVYEDRFALFAELSKTLGPLYARL